MFLVSSTSSMCSSKPLSHHSHSRKSSFQPPNLDSPFVPTRGVIKALSAIYSIDYCKFPILCGGSGSTLQLGCWRLQFPFGLPSNAYTYYPCFEIKCTLYIIQIKFYILHFACTSSPSSQGGSFITILISIESNFCFISRLFAGLRFWFWGRNSCSESSSRLSPFDCGMVGGTFYYFCSQYYYVLLFSI